MEFNNVENILTREELIKIYIDEFNISKEREMMIKGDKYYRSENDILNRQMIRYENERPVVDITKTNNKLAHGFMHNLVDDKVNYLLVKPYTLECEDEEYLESVKETLGKRFQKRLAQLGVEASNKGIAWLYAYIDTEGKFKTMKIPSEQCIPIWIDNDHEELQAFIRYYDVEVYEGKTKRTVTKIEYHTLDGVEYYEMTANSEVILDAEMYLNEESEGTLLPHIIINEQPGSWERVPFIPFKNNDFELPDLQFIKTLIDNYDLTRSDIANELEDVRNLIYVLKGYGGQNLAEFMRDLSYYRAIKIEAGEDSGVDTLDSNININAVKEHYETLKKDIYDFGQGVDKSSDKLGNSPSGIALRFMYSGLDLKCNAMEENFKWGFERLLYFVNKYLELTKQPISDKEITIVFNRDITINETEAVENIVRSQDILSLETLIAQHPWVIDVDEELKKVQAERLEKQKEQARMFGSDRFSKLEGEGDEE